LRRKAAYQRRLDRRRLRYPELAIQAQEDVPMTGLPPRAPGGVPIDKECQ
jgi:hypothetical protein